MNERERLIDIIEKARAEAAGTIGSMNHGFAAWYADKLIEAGVTLNQWIPVTERLPEEDVNVLVAFDDGFIATTCILDGEWELWADAGDVTHWMPLPEPPKEEHDA